MFCIAAFVVFAILGIFSARYRSLARKAWGCVVKKVTFKPCDISFKDEMKATLLGKLIITRPGLARFLDRWLEVFAWIFVILSLWSLLVVLNSGLNLFVYDTCNPNNAESCSLGGEACSVASGKLGFVDSVRQGQVFTWAKDEVTTFGKTITLVPNRLKKWDAKEYVSDSNTYYKPYDQQKPIALEIIDPSCKFCAKLLRNIEEAGFENKYNLTYLVYPIPTNTTANGYKFPYSYLVASYMESAKLHPLAGKDVTADWFILEKMFKAKDSDGLYYQEKFNFVYSEDQAKNLLGKWLAEYGYSESEIQAIVADAGSQKVSDSLERQKHLVEDEIKTIKIPTIMFDGRRFDRVVDVDKLK